MILDFRIWKKNEKIIMSKYSCFNLYPIGGKNLLTISVLLDKKWIQTRVRWKNELKLRNRLGSFSFESYFVACIHAGSTSSRFKLVQQFNHSFLFFEKNWTTLLVMGEVSRYFFLVSISSNRYLGFLVYLKNREFSCEKCKIFLSKSVNFLEKMVTFS